MEIGRVSMKEVHYGLDIKGWIRMNKKKQGRILDLRNTTNYMYGEKLSFDHTTQNK
jgi:hypothetical protein